MNTTKCQLIVKVFIHLGTKATNPCHHQYIQKYLKEVTKTWFTKLQKHNIQTIIGLDVLAIG